MRKTCVPQALWRRLRKRAAVSGSSTDPKENPMTLQQHLLNALHAALIAASVAAASAAMAHGTPDPQHGGVVQTASDIGFELVVTADGAAIYVTDHDEDYDTSRLSGTITVLNGAEKSEAALKPAGGNKLQAQGVKLGKGTKVVAVLNTDGGKPITVRFTVR